MISHFKITYSTVFIIFSSLFNFLVITLHKSFFLFDALFCLAMLLYFFFLILSQHKRRLDQVKINEKATILNVCYFCGEPELGMVETFRK